MHLKLPTVGLLLIVILILLPGSHSLAALRINEFMAANDAASPDPQGDYDDWIEIYNSGPGTADLSGMYLTDDLLEPTQWQFPAGTYIAAGGYLVVWADKDESDNPNGFHTNFKLSSGGEFIGLYATDGNTLIDGISFAEQSEDISYGRFPDGADDWYFMNQSSAGSANAAIMSEAIYFSRLGGVISDSFTLKLSTPSNTGEIRYTTDGSIPAADSNLYNDGSGIFIDNTQSRRIRARAYQPGRASGPVRTEAYLAVSPELQAFDSNVPILVLDTFNQALPPSLYQNGIVQHADPIATYTAFIDTNEKTGRAVVLDQADYAGRTGINIRGQSTSGFEKKPYKLETWDEEDQDIDVPLLGLPADSDWVLHNPYTDRTFMRNALVYQLSSDLGNDSSRTRFVEVFMNEDGGQIGGPDSSDYLGVYVLVEKIKRGENRVNIEKLDPSDNTEPAITGGYIIRRDKPRLEDEFYTAAGRWYYVEPSHDEITDPQKNYIKSYLEEFEAVLQSPDFDDPVIGYSKYIDIDSFIDHDLISEITKEVDANLFSTYVTKDRGGKLKMSPEWDFNWSLGNNDYTAFGKPTQHHTSGWNSRSEDFWRDHLMADPEYLMRYTDRWFDLRETVLSDAHIAQLIDSFYQSLDAGAADRNFNRWDILNSWVGFGWTYPGPTFYYGGNPQIPCYAADHTYSMQVEWLKNWITGTGTPSGACAAEAYAPQYSDRLGWMDANIHNRTGFSAPPSFFINDSPADKGGVITLSDSLKMTSSSETIYYTLDGTDPREAFTGTALGTPYYTGTSTQTISSVLLDAGAPGKAKIPTGAGDAVGWQGAGYDDTGWLSGITGVGYDTGTDFTSLIGLNVSGMQSVNSSVYIRVPFSVSNANDIVSLQLKIKYDDAFVAYINGSEVARSSYVPEALQWNSGATSYHDDQSALIYEQYDIAAAIGMLQEGTNILAIHGLNHGINSSDLLFVPRLEAEVTVTNPPTDPIILSGTVDIRARSRDGATWSAMNQAVFADNRVLDSLRITEIMYHPESSDEEYIELRNMGADPIDLFLCQFTDGIEFTFPEMLLNPGQFVLVVRDQSAFESRYGTGFNIAGEFGNATSLSNGGEEIVLRDAAGREIHDFDYNDWYPITDGHGFSLCMVDPGSADLTLWDQKIGWQASGAIGGNPGSATASLNVASGSIVINEILTHTDAALGDWIELHNKSELPIDISGWYLSDDGDDLKKYQIAAGTSIPGGGYVVFNQVNHFGVGSADAGSLSGFGLSELGESVFLSSGSGNDLSGGYSLSVDFGAAQREITFGRYEKSSVSMDDVDFTAMAVATYGSENSGPLIADVVIKEIMYHSAQDHDELGEYIELFNRSSDPVNLFDPENPSNTWKFTKGIDYTFPPGISLPSGGHILLVRTDPDIFRELYSIPLSRPIFGPYTSALSNDGDELVLSMPGAPETGFVPYISAEKVRYSDGSDAGSNDPWPEEADGSGLYSLQRSATDQYGNDVVNWQAVASTPATPDVSMIEIQRMNGGFYLFWIGSGTLQSATQLSGPWINQTDISSPYPLFPNSEPQQFFRFEESSLLVP